MQRSHCAGVEERLCSFIIHTKSRQTEIEKLSYTNGIISFMMTFFLKLTMKMVLLKVERGKSGEGLAFGFMEKEDPL